MALKKNRAGKRRAWNKGRKIGQQGAFTPAQVKRIRQVLADRGVPGLRDLALFSVAIDTMLQGPELLNLTVKDVQLLNGMYAFPDIGVPNYPPVGPQLDRCIVFSIVRG